MLRIVYLVLLKLASYFCRYTYTPALITQVINGSEFILNQWLYITYSLAKVRLQYLNQITKKMRTESPRNQCQQVPISYLFTHKLDHKLDQHGIYHKHRTIPSTQRSRTINFSSKQTLRKLAYGLLLTSQFLH